MFDDHLPTAFDGYADLSFPVLIGGPAHSGKSNFVTECLLNVPNVAVIGTAAIEDSIFRSHLESIQSKRPASWKIVNEPLGLDRTLSQLSQSHATIIIDSLNQWLGNLLVASLKIHDPAQTVAALQLETSTLLRTLEQLKPSARVVLLTSEVGACPAPPRPAERIFRQCLGQLNVALAKKLPTVIHIQYGLPHFLKHRS